MDTRGAIIYLISKYSDRAFKADTVSYELYEAEVVGSGKISFERAWYQVTFEDYSDKPKKTCWVSVAAVNDLVIPKVTFENPYA